MSLPFNDTLTLRGLVQEYEREIGVDAGTVSGNAKRLAQFAASANIALDDFTALAIQADGTWAWDDSNHEDYPIIKTNLVAGQRDYTLLADEQGNLVLDVFKVFVAGPDGVFREVAAVDVQSGAAGPLGVPGSGQLYTAPNDLSSFTDGRENQGTPFRYDKNATGIFLDPVPSYSYPLGLKAYVNREGSYFTAADTTKKPGVPGLFHKYFYLKPALDYARRKSLKNLAAIQAEVTKLEGRPELGEKGLIGEYFSSRTKDEKPGLRVRQENNH